jgi:hypothetical protein
MSQISPAASDHAAGFSFVCIGRLPMTDRELVLVTGCLEFIAGYCIAQLLNEGYGVLATVRSLAKAEAARAAIGKRRPEECGSAAKAPVSKTGCREFEPSAAGTKSQKQFDCRAA